MKEVRIRPQIADNDLNTLVNRTRKWFQKGHRVKIVVGFRGRQHDFMDKLGPDTIKRFLNLVGTYKTVNHCTKNGNKFFAVIGP